MPGRASIVITEQMLTIRPSPRGIIRLATAWPTWKALSTLVRISRVKVAASNSSSGARACIPALLTRMSRGPTSSSICATPAAAASWSVTSKAT